MNEARPYASLSSGLLARKGAAKPAMRPQNYGSLEDLGWNDMGQEHAPAPPPEHVPSSIAALTPAPKIQRTYPTETHLPSDAESFEDHEGEEAGFEADAVQEEGAEAEEAPQAEVAWQPEAYQPEQAQAEQAYQAEDAFAAEQAEEAFQAEDAQAEEIFQAEEALEAEEIHRPAEAWQAEAADSTAAEDFAAFEAAAPEPAEPVAEIDPPSVVAQQRAILERFDGETEQAAAAAAPHAEAKADIVPLPQRSASKGRRKAAFTLRLDAERHLRLRLACAVTRHSAQQIVARALDEALAGIPEIEALASQVPAKPGRAGKRN